MAISVQKFREIVFQVLYSHDLAAGLDEEELLKLLAKELTTTKATVKQAQIRAKQILDCRDELDTLLKEACMAYDFSRIQSVERNALRLGLFELLYDKEIPPKVAIAEAMRLCRKFSNPTAGSFVNAILDHIYKRSQGLETDEQAVTKNLDEWLRAEEAMRDATKPGD